MATGKFRFRNAANDTLIDLCHGAASASGSSGASTLGNLDAQYDAAVLQPIPNTTPLKGKSYAAGTVIQIDVTTALGGASNTIYLFGFLY